jgi:hypothetical protein
MEVKFLGSYMTFGFEINGNNIRYTKSSGFDLQFIRWWLDLAIRMGEIPSTFVALAAYREITILRLTVIIINMGSKTSKNDELGMVRNVQSTLNAFYIVIAYLIIPVQSSTPCHPSIGIYFFDWIDDLFVLFLHLSLLFALFDTDIWLFTGFSFRHIYIRVKFR